MSQNSNITQLDPAQAFKRLIDADHDAIRVNFPIGLDVAIALSAEEGDSVQTVPRKRDLLQEGADCSDLREVCVYLRNGTTSAKNFLVELSPEADGDDFYPETGGAINPGAKARVRIAVCARRIRVSCDEGVAAKLLGQS